MAKEIQCDICNEFIDARGMVSHRRKCVEHKTKEVIEVIENVVGDDMENDEIDTAVKNTKPSRTKKFLVGGMVAIVSVIVIILMSIYPKSKESNQPEQTTSKPVRGHRLNR